MIDIIGTLLTTPRRPPATSALPDAPVIDEAPHWARAARQAVSTALHLGALGPPAVGRAASRTVLLGPTQGHRCR